METVEGLLPERAVLCDPVGGGREGLRVQPAVVNPPLFAFLHEPGVLENLQVLRNRGQRDLEGLGEVGHAELAEGEPGENRAPCRIGERGERAVE